MVLCEAGDFSQGPSPLPSRVLVLMMIFFNIDRAFGTALLRAMGLVNFDVPNPEEPAPLEGTSH
jgi:hypothetical protein